jgi:hypothetical protein
MSTKPVPIGANSITELACGLRWQPDKEVMMLWAWFDESGTHEGGELRRLTIGGWIAPLDAWTAFSEEWRDALRAAGATAFHGREFRHGRGEFEGWDEVRRRDLMGPLLEVIGRHVRRGFGFSAHAPMDLNDAYIAAGVSCFSRLANQYPGTEVVFAKNEEFKASKLYDFMNIYDTLAGFTLREPKDFPPLQAADLLAYEVQRLKGPEDKGRYPLRRLKELCVEIEIESADWQRWVI